MTSLAAYIGFIWMLLLVAYGQRDPNAFFLNQHIRKSFSSNITASMSANDVLTWANTSLLTHLFGKYPGKWDLCKRNVDKITYVSVLTEIPKAPQG